MQLKEHMRIPVAAKSHGMPDKYMLPLAALARPSQSEGGSVSFLNAPRGHSQCGVFLTVQGFGENWNSLACLLLKNVASLHPFPAQLPAHISHSVRIFSLNSKYLSSFSCFV